MCRTFGAPFIRAGYSRPHGRAYALPALRAWTLAVMSEPLLMQEMSHTATLSMIEAQVGTSAEGEAVCSPSQVR